MNTTSQLETHVSLPCKCMQMSTSRTRNSRTSARSPRNNFLDLKQFLKPFVVCYLDKNNNQMLAECKWLHYERQRRNILLCPSFTVIRDDTPSTILTNMHTMYHLLQLHTKAPFRKGALGYLRTDPKNKAPYNLDKSRVILSSVNHPARSLTVIRWPRSEDAKS